MADADVKFFAIAIVTSRLRLRTALAESILYYTILYFTIVYYYIL